MSARPEVPISFVYDRLSDWRDVVELDVPPHPDELRERLRWGPDGWIAQTYIVLKRRGWNVELTDTVAPRRLSIVYGWTYMHLPRPHDAFLVVVRGDRAPALLADHVLVQNPRQADNRASFVPYWPQPGLLPRDPKRGERFERVGYFGYPSGLLPAFRADEFRQGLADLGLDLALREEAWWNYSDIDAVLAVRHMHPDVLLTKPASKLVNAWHAGCPALLGSEPAFADLRRSALDYLEVATPDDAVQGLRRLRDELGLFRAMVENGRQRAAELSAEAVTARWEAVLSEEIVPAYERWARRRGPRLGRRARLAALRPLQRYTELDYALKVDGSPRAALSRDRSTAHRALAALWLLRAEGPMPFLRALARRAKSIH